MANEMQEFKQKLEESLDTHFPKNQCRERGSALLLFADALMLANRMMVRSK